MSNTIDVCQTGYDYEQFQLNELENENMKLKKQLTIATKALKEYADPRIWEMDGFCYKDGDIARKALKEMEGIK